MIRAKRYDELMEIKNALVYQIVSPNPAIPSEQIQAAYSIITHELQQEGRDIATFLRVIHKKLKTLRSMLKEECDMTEFSSPIRDLNNIIEHFERHDQDVIQNSADDASA